MRTVAQEWENFAAHTIRGPITPKQARDLQLTFFSGAYQMLMLAVQTLGSEASHDLAIAQLVAWHDEMERFFDNAK